MKFKLSRILSSIIAMSTGLLLFSDKLVNIKFDNNYGLYDSTTLIWMTSQNAVPVILIFCFFLNAYRIAYIIPLYIYFIQFYFIFSKIKNDYVLMNLYTIGFVILFLLTIYIVNKYFRKEEQYLKQKISLLEALLDLKISIHD